ncbi:MAG: ParM/StbA family protein, partial [Gammaproteobacteria bacterium]|nr:ParM/StbA family protein [Gammaproteobacteria bacterium]
MTDPSPATPVVVGLDDGYALTKVALSGDRLTVTPSRARVGRSGVTGVLQGRQQIFEYETGDTVYSAGAVDGAPTRFEGYAWSGLNRVIVQHALQDAGLSGRTVHAVSGLPVSAFYRKSGALREELIGKKRDHLKQAVHPLNARPAEIAFHDVIPEALAAWYDHVIVERREEAVVDEKRLSVPVAIIDIGGRTTDYVVVQDQGIVHASSGSLPCGMLDVKQNVADAILERFDLETLGEQRLAQAIEYRKVRLQGQDHDIANLVDAAMDEVVERIHTETRRQLGLGTELDCVLFAGGGTVALAEHIRGWFPHQVIAEHAAFANARGML